MATMFRLLSWILLAPFRLLARAWRWLRVALRRYNTLEIDIDGEVPDRDTPSGLLSLLGGRSRGPALLDLLVGLERASRDPRVRVVLVRLGSFRGGMARAEELLEALRQVRAAGKRVIVLLQDAHVSEYIVALGASEVVLVPAGGLSVTGVASEVMLLGGLLDKAGVSAQLEAIGRYKTARETFTGSEPSRWNREMTESLVVDLYEQLVGHVATERRLSPEEVQARLDGGPYLADAALGAGLVDAVEYPDETRDRLEAELGELRTIGLSKYLSLSRNRVRRGRPTPVALLEVAGPIKLGRSVDGPGGRRATGARSFVKEVERLTKDPRIRAILLRVDSPGGSAVASDLMWRALCRAREKKPVVVSMANVAASGGYYVSGLPGSKIFAMSSTVTGSIGVLGGKFVARELYRHLGINKMIVKRGARAAMLSDFEPFSTGELECLRRDLDVHYRDFVAKMAVGRGRTAEEIHSVAEGRVWTGRQGQQNGLVDARGGLVEALRAIRAELGLHPDAPLALAGARKRRGLSLLLDREGALSGLLDELAPSLEWVRFLGTERVLALLPIQLRFK